MTDFETGWKSTRLSGLNKQILKDLNKDAQRILSHQSEADLAPILAKYCQRYTQRRARRRAVSDQSRTRDTSDGLGANDLPETEALIKVIHPLDQNVLECLNDLESQSHYTAKDTHDIKCKIDLAIAKGTPLHPLNNSAIVRISSNIVLKTHEGEDQNEIVALRHIQEHGQRIPSPRLLGALTYSGKTRIFMSYVNGQCLKELWPSLLPAQKSFVRDQIADIVSELRTLPPPSEYLGCGTPPTCIDIKASKHQSRPYIRNEAEFNDFLLSTPRSRISRTYLAFIKENCLQTNHGIVMTHGDLTPRNIIVARSDTDVKIVGIVDWECAGAYPEYWEYLKTLNTFSSVEEDDWCWYLPHAAIGR